MSDKHSSLTQSTLRELLRYDPASGIFTWKKSRGGAAVAGSIAGWTNSGGYRAINLLGKTYYAHRLAWFYIRGEWPDVIDHKNGDPSDNSFSNLRSVTFGENLENMRRPMLSNKSSRLLGVTFSARSQKWKAQISVKNKNINIGEFHSPQEAHLAYLEAKRALHAGCLI